MSGLSDKRREQKRRYRERVREVSLSFDKALATELEKRAEQKGLTLPAYIRSCVMNDFDGTGYVLPSSTELHQLIRELKTIGNNINQLIRFVHADGEVQFSDIRKLQDQLADLENIVHQSLTEPQPIEQVLGEYLQKHPEHQDKLIQLIHDYQGTST